MDVCLRPAYIAKKHLSHVKLNSTQTSTKMASQCMYTAQGTLACPAQAEKYETEEVAQENFDQSCSRFQGSFKQSCRNCRTSAWNLIADCDIRPGVSKTSQASRGCRAFRNENGQLRCE